MLHGRERVESLLFPVKPGFGLGARLRGFILVLAAVAPGCGFHTPMSVSPDQRLAISAGASVVAEPGVLDAVLAGCRDELVTARAIRSSGYPKLVIEITRVDELPAGIAATDARGGPIPLARGSEVGIVGRAYVIAGEGASPSRDTGDVRRVETVLQDADPSQSRFAYEEGIRSAARRLGAALARRILGHAEPGLDDM